MVDLQQIEVDDRVTVGDGSKSRAVEPGQVLAMSFQSKLMEPLTLGGKGDMTFAIWTNGEDLEGHLTV